MSARLLIIECWQALEAELEKKAQAERQLPAFDVGDAVELQLVRTVSSRAMALMHSVCHVMSAQLSYWRRSRRRTRAGSLSSRASALPGRSAATGPASPCATASPMLVPLSAAFHCAPSLLDMKLGPASARSYVMSPCRYSPTVKGIRVLQTQRVKARRAKLYYLRDRLGKEYSV